VIDKRFLKIVITKFSYLYRDFLITKFIEFFLTNMKLYGNYII